MTLPPFQQLVDAHWRDVGRLAHALAGPVDGDDVAQQAWTQALAAYPRLRSADIGRPRASRAVGAVRGANPLCVVLPCHRVVASSGALTGYAGGLAAKEYLLTLESRP